MRFTTRFAILLGGVFLATVVLAPLVKLALDGLIGTAPGIADTLRLRLDDGVYDFGRVHRRVFLLVALVAIVGARRWLGGVPLLGVRGDEGRLRALGLGLAAGIVSWSAFLLLLLAAGRRTLDAEPAAQWLTALPAAVVTALLVGLVEETALRGYLLGGLAREMPRVAAVLLSSALYSVLHFMRAEVPVQVGRTSPGIGLEALLAHLGPLADPAVLGPFVGLSLVGVVLGYVYLWSRSLPLAIGVHAGWVLLIRLDGLVFLEPLGQRGVYGKDGVLAGVGGWLFLLLLLAAFRPLAAWSARAPAAAGDRG